MAVKRKAAARSEARYCMYLGPTIRGVIQNGQVFPGSAEDAFVSLPERWRTREVRMLLVNEEQIPEALGRLQGGLLRRCRDRLADGTGA